jgi:hypothetical protein
MWANLQPFGSQVEYPQGLHQNKVSQWIHSVGIIACGSTNHMVKEEGRQTAAVCR